MRIVIGARSISLSEICRIPKGQVIPLKRSASDPVEIYVGDRLIGLGELEEESSEGETMLGVRIIEVFKEDS
ncbi:FliM/FliN family flagellar motor C-terminal domain-containing protein [Poseidonocella sp. HB161398]|uniref:FliM/FliN family flagellar motor switch protein n=1 Tax=Poseidonocella sp. HB161398 TaxID=2320855 RepID=UPI001109669A